MLIMASVAEIINHEFLLQVYTSCFWLDSWILWVENKSNWYNCCIPVGNNELVLFVESCVVETNALMAFLLS